MKGSNRFYLLDGFRFQGLEYIYSNPVGIILPFYYRTKPFISFNQNDTSDLLDQGDRPIIYPEYNIEARSILLHSRRFTYSGMDCFTSNVWGGPIMT